MKKTIRALLICLALILCLTPVLMACDSADSKGGNDVTNNENAGNDAASVEGRRIATYTSFDKSHKVRMYQIEETNGAEKVKCSLVLYTADGAILDSVTFDVKVNGEDAKFECFHKATWHDDKVEIIVRDHDNAETTYTLKYSK
ncbi:MAG: hypothetical protein J6B24_02295 [Clostridia bacterium]|nr:hypothetical protein [Clostridia bacterium]